MTSDELTVLQGQVDRGTDIFPNEVVGKLLSHIRDLSLQVGNREAFLQRATGADYMKRIPMPTRAMTVNIEECVCRYFKIQLEDVMSKYRAHDHIVPRHVIWYLIYTEAKLTMTSIGKHYNVHHTTVVVAVRKIRNAARNDVVMKNHIARIMEMIKEPLS